jgi:hypothetical protein
MASNQIVHYTILVVTRIQLILPFVTSSKVTKASRNATRRLEGRASARVTVVIWA